MSSGISGIDKLTRGGDYILWKQKILAHFESLDLLEAIKEEEVEDRSPGITEVTKKWGEESEKFQILEEKRRKARAFIILSVEDHILRMIMKETTASGMIKTLDQFYMSRPSSNRIYLKRKLYEFGMSEDISIEENINEFLKLVSELDKENVDVSDETKAMVLLKSLPRRFDKLKDSLVYSEYPLTLGRVMRAIHMKEVELSQTVKQEKEDEMVVSKTERGRPDCSENTKEKEKAESVSRRSVTPCCKCGERGHVRKECFKGNESNQLRERFIERSEATTTKSSNQDESASLVSDFASLTRKECSDVWFCDTGCTSHMTPRKEWFVDLKMLEPGSVTMANNTASQVKGIGSVRIQNEDGTTVLLTNVKYVPDMSRSLISLGTLENKGCWFKSKNGILKVIKGCLTLLKAQKSESLYILKGSAVAVGPKAAKILQDETEMWQRNATHRNQEGLKILDNNREKNSGREAGEEDVQEETQRIKFVSEKPVTEEKLKNTNSELRCSTLTPRLVRNWHFLKKVEWKKIVETLSSSKEKNLITRRGVKHCDLELDSICRQEEVAKINLSNITLHPSGSAEKANRLIVEKESYLLSENVLLEEIWAEGTARTLLSLARSSSSTVLDPDSLTGNWTGSLSCHKKFQRFGCVVNAHSDQEDQISRFKKRSLLVYPHGVTSFRVWLLEQERCVASRGIMHQEPKMHKDDLKVLHTFKLSKESQGISQQSLNGANCNLLSVQGGAIGVDSRMRTLLGGDSGFLKIISEEDDINVKESDDEVDKVRLRVCQSTMDQVRRDIKPNKFHGGWNAFRLTSARIKEEDGQVQVSLQEEIDVKERYKCRQFGGGKSDISKGEMPSFDPMSVTNQYSQSNWAESCGVCRRSQVLTEEQSKLQGKGRNQWVSKVKSKNKQERFLQAEKCVSNRSVMHGNDESCLELDHVRVESKNLHLIKNEFILMDQPARYEEKETGCISYDIVNISNGNSEIKLLKYLISTKVDLGNLDEEEEIEIQWLAANRDKFRAASELFLEECLKRKIEMFSVVKSKSVFTLREDHFKFKAAATEELASQRNYMECVSALTAEKNIMNSMIRIRPANSCPAGVIRSFMGSQQEESELVVSWTQRNCRKNLQVCLNSKEKNSQVRSGCKSVYEIDQDKRRSVLLFEFTAGDIISQGRTEVQEAVGFSFAEETEVANMMRKLFAEDGFQQAIVEVYCDFKSETTLVKITICQRGLKGFDTRRQFIEEMIAELVIKVVKSEKAYQAGSFTKVTIGRMLQADMELLKVSQA
ncbi:Zinc finger CCHC-type [Arabidopsis suecica]|uniref:Zinc finger CCHC-type n=1 Tax=Arabidopsis suecica TaxID=45249 RepID=A0A8T1ZVZ5_ARASU|nr:Zinc finger CCHC-type [Arabidopsis suecica]